MHVVTHIVDAIGLCMCGVHLSLDMGMLRYNASTEEYCVDHGPWCRGITCDSKPADPDHLCDLLAFVRQEKRDVWDKSCGFTWPDSPSQQSQLAVRAGPW